MAGRVTLVGLGPGDPGMVTLGALQSMRDCEVLLLRTERHPSVAHLAALGLEYEPLDRFYEAGQSFQEVYESISEYVVERAQEASVCYAVPGDPWTGESTTPLVQGKCEAAGIGFSTLSGVSFLEPLFAATGADPFSGLSVVDATSMRPGDLTPWVQTVVCQVYSRLVAGDAKLLLLEVYPPEHQVAVLRAAGTPSQHLKSIPLFELDHESTAVDHLTSIVIPPVPGAPPGVTGAQGSKLSSLVDIMDRLRGDGGCPWDREQTHETLKPYVIEEAFEVLEAIESGRADKLCEELGDLLLQVVFHAQVADENEDFAVNDVIDEICAKLIRRHPHVFGNVVVKDSDAVLVNWERIKRGEKGNEDRKSILDGVPVHLPALLKADKTQSKAAKVGFDWDKPEDALDKVWEESQEFKEAFELRDRDRMEDEMGDLFFAIVNVARLLGINPEFALRRTIDKFSTRFRHIEARAAEQGRTLQGMTLPEMDEFWNEAKALARHKT